MSSIIKTSSARKIKLDVSDRIVRGVAYVIVTFFTLLCLFPFLLMISASLTDETVIMKEGFSLWPKEFSLLAYNFLVTDTRQMVGSYVVTIALTASGSFCGLWLISMTGYALQRRDFPYRNRISFFIYFTTLFSGGLLPIYMVMTKLLNLADSYFAVFFPLLMTPWLIVLMKNFVKSIPHEITESGKIDGAGDFRIFFQLIFPNLKPALATIGLFLALGYWNEWYNSLLYLSSRVAYYPLQYHLYNIINKSEALKNSIAGANVVLDITVAETPTQSLKMATAVFVTGPIILLYPFVQRYFIKGITIGSVKG